MFRRTLYTLLGATMLIPVNTALAETSDNPLSIYPDGAPVVLTGTINEIRDDEFDINYGNGAVTVELDGWKWTGNETKYLHIGDAITVSGRIDDDLFEGREIEADNIFLPNSYAYYYTNDAYPSYYLSYDQDNIIHDGSYVSIRGTVSDIDGREFDVTSIGTNKTKMRVDASELDYDPFDDEGIKIKPGDQVHVYGTIDDGFFESREIIADSIVTLSQVNANP